MTDDFDRLSKALSSLPEVIRERVVKGATRAAAKSVADDAKRRAPVRTGLLKKSIGVVKARKSDTPAGHVVYYVVPRTKVRFTAAVTIDGKSAKMKAVRYAFYAHMVEFGTAKMSAKPFMRPAYEASASTAIDAFKSYASRRIDREVEKLR